MNGVAGTEITITVIPAQNYRLKPGTLKHGTTPIDETTQIFVLPAENIIVTAEFELVSEIKLFHEFDDFEGNTLRFYAEESFDIEAYLVDSIGRPFDLAHPGNQAWLVFFAEYVASLTLKLNVDGGRQVSLGSDGRAIVLSDGTGPSPPPELVVSMFSVEIDLVWGRLVASGLLQPTSKNYW